MILHTIYPDFDFESIDTEKCEAVARTLLFLGDPSKKVELYKLTWYGENIYIMFEDRVFRIWPKPVVELKEVQENTDE